MPIRSTPTIITGHRQRAKPNIAHCDASSCMAQYVLGVRAPVDHTSPQCVNAVCRPHRTARRYMTPSEHFTSRVCSMCATVHERHAMTELGWRPHRLIISANHDAQHRAHQQRRTSRLAVAVVAKRHPRAMMSGGMAHAYMRTHIIQIVHQTTRTSAQHSIRSVNMCLPSQVVYIRCYWRGGSVYGC